MSHECIPPDPCTDWAALDPKECCEFLRGRLELLQAELRTLRSIVSRFSVDGVPGPFEDNEAAEAGGVAEWQIYFNNDEEFFVRIPTIPEEE